MNIKRFRRLRKIHGVRYIDHDARRTSASARHRTAGRLDWLRELFATPRPVLGWVVAALFVAGLAFALFATRDESKITRPAEAEPTVSAPASTSPTQPAPAPAPAPGGGQPNAAPLATHTVRGGEALAGIALQSGVGFEDIAAANTVADPNRIRAGQRLAIPSPLPDVVVIRPGSTLSDYAAEYGRQVDNLLALNPQITDQDHILAGGRLLITGQVAR